MSISMQVCFWGKHISISNPGHAVETTKLESVGAGVLWNARYFFSENVQDLWCNKVNLKFV